MASNRRIEEKKMRPRLLFSLIIITRIVFFRWLSASAPESFLDRFDKMRVEAALFSLGFREITIGGDFDRSTRNAIEIWQRQNGHKPTGYITEEQYHELVKVISR